MRTKNFMSTTDVGTRAARIITEVFTPVLPVLLICLMCGVYGHPNPWLGLAWGAVIALFSAVIPFVIVEFGVHRRRLSDRQVTSREQRWGVYAMCIASVLCGLATVLLLDAPPLLVWALLTMVAGLVVCAAVTALMTKVSVHLFCLTAMIVFASLIVSPWLLIALPILVPTVAWSRHRLGHHSLLEITLGASLGAVVTLVSWIFVPLP